MDNLGTEVSNKIRSAIKAKLIELDAYVDDELPDYIMVMVANDRTEDQMNEDLGLFLNDHTKAFTTWLHNVLDKLKKVTLEEVAKKDSKKKKTKDSGKKKEKVKKTSSSVKDKEKDKKKKKKVVAAPSGGKEGNANLIDIGSKKKKKEILPPPSPESDHNSDRGEGGGYNPEAILKKAVKSSAKSLKVNAEKRSTPVKKVKKKKIYSKKDDQGFFQANRSARARERSRSYSVERRGHVSSQVQIVRKARSRSRSMERRSVASKAILPPRPHRPSGREDRGLARMLSRSLHDADRSLRGGRRISRSPDLYDRDHSRSPLRSRRDSSSRSRDERRVRLPQLSLEDIERYRRLKELKESKRPKRERSKDKKRKSKDKDKDKDKVMARKLKREVDLLTTRQLAMDKELQKLSKHNKDTIVDIATEEDEEDEIRIIVRRDDSPEQEEETEKVGSVEKVVAAQIAVSAAEQDELEDDGHDDADNQEQQEEERHVVVEEQDDDESDGEGCRKVTELEDSSAEPGPSPPKKSRKSEENNGKKSGIELDDAELMEMRRKALESLMRKRGVETKSRDIKSRVGDTKSRGMDSGIGIGEDKNLNDASSSDSDSETSLSDSENEKEKEPTFIVTMDGIDDKYFKDGHKPVSAEKTRRSPVDDSLELYTEESFDSPSHSPAPHHNNKSRLSPPLKSAKSKSSESGKSSSSSTVKLSTMKSTKVDSSKKSSQQTVAKQSLKRSVSPTSSKPVIKSTLTDSAKPFVAATKTPGDKKLSKRPAIETKKAVKRVSTGSIVTEKKHVIITPDGKTIVTKQVATVKPSVAKPVTKGPTAVTIAKPSVSKPAVAKPAVANPPVDISAKPSKPKTKIIIRKVSSSEEALKGVGEVQVATKPKFKPIIPPTHEQVLKPSPIQYTTTVYSKPTPIPVASNLEVCKFFPNCTRGNACFFYHPKPGAQVVGGGGVRAPVSRFKWKAT